MVELTMGSETVRFWSSADFGLLAHVQELAHSGVDYSLFVMAWQSGDAWSGGWAKRLGLSRRVGGAAASVWQIEGPGLASPKALAAIRALHNHLDTNKEMLATEQSELRKLSDRLEVERKQKELHPPDQVIEFFPIRSRHSSGTPQSPSDQ